MAWTRNGIKSIDSMIARSKADLSAGTAGAVWAVWAVCRSQVAAQLGGPGLPSDLVEGMLTS